MIWIERLRYNFEVQETYSKLSKKLVLNNIWYIASIPIAGMFAVKTNNKK